MMWFWGLLKYIVSFILTTSVLGYCAKAIDEDLITLIFLVPLIVLLIMAVWH